MCSDGSAGLCRSVAEGEGWPARVSGAILPNIVAPLYWGISLAPYSYEQIGSQAGTEGFKETIEEKEGVGAVDNESLYIKCMQEVHCWAGTSTAENDVHTTLTPLPLQAYLCEQGFAPDTFNVHLVEPGLVNTSMARREFSFLPVNWDTDVQQPSAFANELLQKLI